MKGGSILKIKYVSLGIVLALFVNQSLFAANQTSASAVAKVHVESIFSIELNRTDIDFESISPGESKYDVPATGIKVTTKTNTGRSWSLAINALSNFKSNDHTIDNQNFQWYGWTEGKGTWKGEKENTMTLTPVTVYESSDIEALNYPEGTHNFFKFKLSIPSNQKPGDYQTIIRFTITE